MYDMSERLVICPRCSEPFGCGVDTGACWCAQVTVDDITRAAFAQYYDGCLCPDCLRTLESSRPQRPTVRTFAEP